MSSVHRVIVHRLVSLVARGMFSTWEGYRQYIGGGGGGSNVIHNTFILHGKPDELNILSALMIFRHVHHGIPHMNHDISPIY